MTRTPEEREATEAFILSAVKHFGGESSLVEDMLRQIVRDEVRATVKPLFDSLRSGMQVHFGLVFEHIESKFSELSRPMPSDDPADWWKFDREQDDE